MIEVKVRCSGKLHRIVLKDNGKLVLVDHPHALEEQAILAIGGEPCTCFKILKSWRNQRIGSVPRPLRPALTEASEVRKDRRSARLSGVDPLLRHVFYRVEPLIAKVATKCLEKTWYAKGRQCRAHLLYQVYASPHAREVKIGRRQPPLLEAHIRRSWYRKVFMRGIAVVDGVFVLDVLEETAGGYVVLAQKSPLDFFPRQARVKDGKLEWLK